MGLLDSALQVLLPKGRQKPGGTSYDPTFKPNQPKLTVPTYRTHLQDLPTTRLASDSRTLLNELTRHDPDASSAVHSYLTIAGSAHFLVEAFDENGEPSLEGMALGRRILDAISETADYTLGASTKPRLTELFDAMRYLTLLRGGPAAELVFDKRYVPTELRIVDPATIEWQQPTPGRLVPVQKPPGAGVEINLDIPTFFTARFHQNPTDQYNYSTFVSVVNTISARQMVINELYRVMQVTGFPRMDIEVLEEVLTKHAPATVRQRPEELREYLAARMAEIRASFDGLRSDQAMVHTEAVKAKILNERSPAAGLSIQGVIDCLDAQNQAGLKVMPAVVGKGTDGNTASTEARLFAMSCDALNRTIANLVSPALTLAARLAGFAGKVHLRFHPVELRPLTELEPHLVMRSSRLRTDLSLGIITDLEYCMQVYGRPPLAGSPVLSGTNFLAQGEEATVDTSAISPNTDPLGRSLTPSGGSSARSNGVQDGGGRRARGS